MDIVEQPQFTENTPPQPSRFSFLPFTIALILIALGLLIFVYKLFQPDSPLRQFTAPPIKSPATENRVAGQLIIKPKPHVTEEQLVAHLKRYNAKIIKRISEINRFVIQVPKGQEDAIQEKLLQDNLIEKAEPNYLRHINFTPNDPLLSQQWHLNKIGAQTAWDVARGQGVKVAVIDTGINLNHPEFAGKIVGQKVFTTTSIEDQLGHGTHVAGTIAAGTNNGQGVAGVCPECQLIIAKSIGDSGSGPDDLVIQGILWAADQGAKVINVSAGGPDTSSAYDDAIAKVTQQGAIIVAAAGNDGSSLKTYPAAFPGVISVAASDQYDRRASFSNYGAWVKVAAPGVDVLSTFPTHSYGLQSHLGTGLNYGRASGTSMAAPIVSGILGILWSSSYGTSAQSVTQRLYETADKISGTGTYWTEGRINLAKALSGAPITPTAVPTPTPTKTPTPTPSISSIPTVSPTPPLTTQPLPTATPKPSSVPTAVPTSVPTPFPTAPSPFVCLGSCPTQPSSTPIPTAKPTPTPTAIPIATVTAVQPSPTEIVATALPQPTHEMNPTPLPTPVPGGQPLPENLGLFLQIIQLIMRLIELLLRQ